MPLAQGSRSGLSYVVESTFGTTPGTPSMISLPFSTHSLELVKQRLQSTDILSDRLPRIDRHGNKNVAGDIVAEFRDTDYDDFIESAMFSAFDTSGVIKVGTTLKSLTIEDAAEDIAQYRAYTGCVVNTMGFSIAPNQMSRVTFGIIGKGGGTPSGTPLDASLTAPSGGEPTDSYSGAINEGGSSIAIVSSLEFTLNNSLAPIFVVGSDETPQLEYGQAVVEGTVTVHYENATLINKFINETETSISVTLDDPVSGGAYTFDFPRVKYNGAPTPVSSPQSRLISIPFVALRDVSEGTNLKITKA